MKNIHRFVKKAGMKSDKDFYKKYPDEESFFKDYPDMRKAEFGMDVPNKDMYKQMDFSDSMIAGMQSGAFQSSTMNGGQPQQLDAMGKTATRIQKANIGALPMQQMSIPYQQYNPDMQMQDMPQMQPISLDEESTDSNPTPYKKIPSNRKPIGIGTGDLIAGGLSLAAGLLPEHESANHFHKQHYGTYDENAYGTGSTALYADGGSVYPGNTTVKKRQVGGFAVTEEIPTNLGYGTQTQLPVVTAPIPAPFPIPHQQRQISYNQLAVGDRNGRPIYEPVPSGGWNAHDWNAAMSDGTIPDSYKGVQVLKGQPWTENWNQPQQSDSSQWSAAYGQTSNRTLIDITSNMGNKSKQPYNLYSFEDGGNIHIKPENKGKFNATKKKTGKTTEELTHSKDPVTRKRAIFAMNAKGFSHAKKKENGGLLQGSEHDMSAEQINNLISLGYEFDF